MESNINILDRIEIEFQDKFDFNINLIDKFISELKSNETKINKFIDENCNQYSVFLDKIKGNLNESLPIEKSKFNLFELFMNRCYNSITNDFEVKFKSLKLLKTEFILGLQNNYIHCMNNEVNIEYQVKCIRGLNDKTIIYINSRIIDYYDKLDKINSRMNMTTIEGKNKV